MDNRPRWKAPKEGAVGALIVESVQRKKAVSDAVRKRRERQERKALEKSRGK